LTGEPLRGFAKELGLDTAPLARLVPSRVASFLPSVEAFRSRCVICLARLALPPFFSDGRSTDLAAASLAEDFAFEAFRSRCAICLARLALPPFFSDGRSTDLATASFAEDFVFEAFRSRCVICLARLTLPPFFSDGLVKRFFVSAESR
jgi:hypothetical protein